MQIPFIDPGKYVRLLKGFQHHSFKGHNVIFSSLLLGGGGRGADSSDSCLQAGNSVPHSPPQIILGCQLLEAGFTRDNQAWQCAQFQQKKDAVKPTKTIAAVKGTSMQSILKLIGFAIKRCTEHAMQLILHKLGQELNIKAVGYFSK